MRSLSSSVAHGRPSSSLLRTRRSQVRVLHGGPTRCFATSCQNHWRRQGQKGPSVSMDRLDQLFSNSCEHIYINNVTPSTCEWYRTAWKAFTAARASAPPRPASSRPITKANLRFLVVHLRERGVKPKSCNCWV